MKSQQLELLKPTFPLPIAGSDSDATDIPKDSGNLNREYGFKADYFNDDALVTKDDFNGVLKSATSNLAYGNAGGFYEFNPEVAEAIGGYAKGAVLTFMYGGAMHLVRSMHDNNLVNFNEVGVNGLDWELVLPNDSLQERLMPDIDWNARKARLIYSYSSNSGSGVLASGTFDSKGYVVVVNNNAKFPTYPSYFVPYKLYNVGDLVVCAANYSTYGTDAWIWKCAKQYQAQNFVYTYEYWHWEGRAYDKWQLYLISGSQDGSDISDATYDNIFGNPLSSSKKAFPIPLIYGFNGYAMDQFDLIKQVQVQKGANYKLMATRSNISSGSYDIYFLPTPD